MEPYINDFIALIKSTGNDIGKFLQFPWGIPQVGTLAIPVVLLAFKKFGFAITYAVFIFFMWGLLKVLGQAGEEDARSWINIMIYVALGGGVFATTFYLGVIRTKD